MFDVPFGKVRNGTSFRAEVMRGAVRSNRRIGSRRGLPRLLYSSRNPTRTFHFLFIQLYCPHVSSYKSPSAPSLHFKETLAFHATTLARGSGLHPRLVCLPSGCQHPNQRGDPACHLAHH